MAVRPEQSFLDARDLRRFDSSPAFAKSDQSIRQTGTTERVSLSSQGNQGNSDSLLSVARWAAATSNPPARASGDSDGLRGHLASGGRLLSIPIAVC